MIVPNSAAITAPSPVVIAPCFDGWRPSPAVAGKGRAVVLVGLAVLDGQAGGDAQAACVEALLLGVDAHHRGLDRDV